MDAKSYCDRMEIELTGWKAKIYDAIQKTNKLSAGDRERVEPIIQDLHTIMDELDERLELLERECPADWTSQRKKIEEKMAKMDTAWKNVWGVMGEI
ncbi:MAG: hypothetical protein JSU83_20260 [Deltaproteobacteria bacterium]|nr:MAG: hypothetical protein JSU83_20260 [Deltaproteobacteria bacterium]